jgi:predicted phosphodiesterase
MRVAALYDIHGNLPALEAVLDEVRAAKVDRVIVGGDVIPGPMPGECLELLFALEVPIDFIIGNGDRETLVARRGQVSAAIPEYFRESMRWNAAQLTAQQAAAISDWPLTTQLQVDGIGRVLFCHATPRNDTEIFTAMTAEEKLRPIFEPLSVSLVVCGHVHMQFDRMVGTTRVINAGSVGMPFQEPGAYWLLLDARAELRRTPYDLDAAANRVRRTEYPLAEDFAAKSILEPPSQGAMSEVFSKAELS